MKNPNETSEPNTRQSILQATQRLVQTRSYSGFSYEDLAERVGIRKASIYHHFSSKDQLTIAMLTRSKEKLLALTTDNPGNAMERLSSYLEVMGKNLGAGTCLCPGGAMVANWDLLSKPIKRAVIGLRDAHLDILRAIFSEALKEGSVPRSAGSANDLAECVFATLQGALLLARISEKPKDYQDITELVLKAIKGRS